MRTCPVCQKLFEPTNPLQKYCSKKCVRKAQRERSARVYQLRVNFNLEWAAWKRDFALGKTQSNL